MCPNSSYIGYRGSYISKTCNSGPINYIYHGTVKCYQWLRNPSIRISENQHSPIKALRSIRFDPFLMDVILEAQFAPLHALPWWSEPCCVFILQVAMPRQPPTASCNLYVFHCGSVDSDRCRFSDLAFHQMYLSSLDLRKYLAWHSYSGILSNLESVCSQTYLVWGMGDFSRHIWQRSDTSKKQTWYCWRDTKR